MRDRENRFFSKAGRAFRIMKIGGDDRKRSNNNSSSANNHQEEDLPWGGKGLVVSAANQDTKTNIESNNNGDEIFSSNVTKDAKGKKIVDEYLGNSERDLDAGKNSKKLDEYGFIVNLDDTGNIRDEDSIALPGGAYTPSSQYPDTNNINRARAKAIKKKKKAQNSKKEQKHLNKLYKRREKKWIDMLENWNGMFVTKPKENKLRQRIRKGIPNSVRGEAWVRLAKVDKKVNRSHKGLYTKLVTISCEKNGNSEDLVGLEGFEPNQESSVDISVMKETIERDLTRTFPRHNMFYDDGEDDSDEEYSDDDSIDKLSRNSESFDSISNPSGCEDEDPINNMSSDGQEEVKDKSDHNGATINDTNDTTMNNNTPATDENKPTLQSDSYATNEIADSIQGCATDCLNTVVVPAVLSVKEASFLPMSDGVEVEYQTEIKGTSTPKRKKDKVIDFTKAEGGLGKLRRVLRAYSIYDSEVGYCQGMNFIAGMFITYVNEESAFWLLVHVMNEAPCTMRGLFGEGMTEAHQVLHVADRLISHFHPRLARHFDKEGIHISMFATQWLLTIYTSSFPFDVVTRVWDAFLSEGWKVPYRVMLALLEMSQPTLMRMNFEEILNYFKEMPFEIDANEIMELSFKIPLKKKHIVKYAKDFDRKKNSGAS